MSLLTSKQSKGSKEPDVSINLLPSEVRSDQATKRWFNIGATAAIALVVILALITIVLRFQISSAERNLRTEQAKAAELRTQVSSLADFEALEASINGTKGLLATALAGDISWTRFLDELDTSTPTDSWLQSISVQVTSGADPLGQPSLGTVQYNALVTSFPGLANWLDTMSGINGQHFVYLSTGTKDPATGKITFSANSNVTSELLSGRCQGEGSQCP
jgi:Tfp pilus assembly protein PilN